MEMYAEISTKLSSKRSYLVIKRLKDFIGALCGLIVFSPILLLIALLIKIEDPKGKVVFGHKRLGESGGEFSCLKFRSMFSNAEEMKANFTEAQKKEFEETYKLKDDPRITKVGRFIRRTSLDELPQFVNILRGEMSIVGPRPIVKEELKYYKGYEEYYFACRPGLTGLWQTSGRSNTSYEERVAFDIEYAQSRRTGLDIKIIFATIAIVLKREGSY